MDIDDYITPDIRDRWFIAPFCEGEVTVFLDRDDNCGAVGKIKKRHDGYRDIYHAEALSFTEDGYADHIAHEHLRSLNDAFKAIQENPFLNDLLAKYESLGPQPASNLANLVPMTEENFERIIDGP